MYSVYKARRLWRQKYPWLLVVFIIIFAVLLGLLKQGVSPQTGYNILTIAILATFIILYIAYIYGVRPDELEHHFQ